ncbi:MAG: hypothetical protein AAF086_03035, partial [Planctomycetota bacterium]
MTLIIQRRDSVSRCSAGKRCVNAIHLPRLNETLAKPASSFQQHRPKSTQTSETNPESTGRALRLAPWNIQTNSVCFGLRQLDLGADFLELLGQL